MLYDGIEIAVSAERPYGMCSEFRASAHADGIAYLGDEPCGTASLSGHEGLEALASETRIAEGAYVIDKRALGASEDAIAAVYSGPMADPSLAPRTIRECLEESRTFASVVDALQDPATSKGFTYVSLDIYAEFWRRLGARIGRKINGAIVWEGQTELYASRT